MLTITRFPVWLANKLATCSGLFTIDQQIFALHSHQYAPGGQSQKQQTNCKLLAYTNWAKILWDYESENHYRISCNIYSIHCTKFIGLVNVKFLIAAHACMYILCICYMFVPESTRKILRILKNDIIVLKISRKHTMDMLDLEMVIK